MQCFRAHPASKGEAANNDFYTRVLALNPGAASLSVKVVSDVAAVTTPGATLEDSVLLDVVERLAVLSDTSLFLPFGAKSLIRTTRDGSSGLSYFVQIAFSARSAADAEISVSPSGAITTGSTPLIATVFVTETFKGLNQTVAVYVEVASVAHVAITPLLGLWPPNSNDAPPYNLPTGVSASFAIQLHDASGRAFDTCDMSMIQVSLLCHGLRPHFSSSSACTASTLFGSRMAQPTARLC